LIWRFSKLNKILPMRPPNSLLSSTMSSFINFNPTTDWHKHNMECCSYHFHFFSPFLTCQVTRSSHALLTTHITMDPWFRGNKSCIFLYFSILFIKLILSLLNYPLANNTFRRCWIFFSFLTHKCSLHSFFYFQFNFYI